MTETEQTTEAKQVHVEKKREMSESAKIGERIKKLKERISKEGKTDSIEDQLDVLEDAIGELEDRGVPKAEVKKLKNLLDEIK